MKASERHKLKHDKAAETMVGGLDWARKHQSVIVAVFVALIVIIVGSFWLVSTRRQAVALSAQQLEDAQRLANSVLNAQAQGKEMGKDTEIDTVIRQFDQIASDNPKSAIGAQALLSAGQLLMRAGSADQALSYFERAADAAGEKFSGLKSLAWRGMAETLEAMGKPDKAIEQYMRFTTTPFDPQAIQAYWDIGRCYEELKDKEKAEESYNRAKQSGEKSEWAQMAAFRLSELAAGADLLGAAPVAMPPPSSTATTMAPGTTTTSTTPAAPPPAAEQPAVKAPAEETPPPPAPAPAAEPPQQKPDDQTQF